MVSTSVTLGAKVSDVAKAPFPFPPWSGRAAFLGDILFVDLMLWVTGRCCPPEMLA